MTMSAAVGETLRTPRGLTGPDLLALRRQPPALMNNGGTALSHDEADITMISCVIEAAKSGKSVINVLSDWFTGCTRRSWSARYRRSGGMEQ